MKWTFRHTSVAAVASWWLISCIKLDLTVETWASELGQGGLTLFPSLYQRNTWRHQGAPWEEDNPVKALRCWGPCPAGEPCRPPTPVSWNHAPCGLGPPSAEKGTEQQMLSDGLRRRTTRFRCWAWPPNSPGFNPKRRDPLRAFEDIMDCCLVPWTQWFGCLSAGTVPHHSRSAPQAYRWHQRRLQWISPE